MGERECLKIEGTNEGHLTRNCRAMCGHSTPSFCIISSFPKLARISTKQEKKTKKTKRSSVPYTYARIKQSSLSVGTNFLTGQNQGRKEGH